MRFKLLALALALAVGCSPAAKERALVHNTERMLQSRTSRLDALVGQLQSVPSGRWSPAVDVPDDMVVYRYENGELNSWIHSFPVTNDALGATAEIERLVHPRLRMRSPLSDIGTGWTLVNLGSKWYLAKAYETDRVSKTIAGLELPDSRECVYLPLSDTEGAEVHLHGVPILKIARPADGDRRGMAGGQPPYSSFSRNFTQEYRNVRVWAGNLAAMSFAPLDSRSRRDAGGIHPRYSFAKYEGGTCVFFRAPYPYPSKLIDSSPFLRDGIVQSDGYVHFVYSFPGGVRVLVSRPAEGAYHYILLVLLLLVTVAFIFFMVKRGPERHTSRNHFSTRISMVLLFSLLITLASLATVSVAFVAGRYQKSTRSQMQERLSMTQILLQRCTRGAATSDDLLTVDMQEQMRQVAQASRTPVSMYRTDGRLFMTTAPELIERGICPARLNERAYQSLVLEGGGSLIQKEGRRGRPHYGMYAPLFGLNGQVVAILFTPYFQGTYDIERDTVMHAISILAVFLILLMVSYLLTSAILGKVFSPLSELGRKMSEASLEPVEYDGNDEITPLVESYNRMVSELERSTVKLAQAERDKAWSGMARQVAHEIKNPLTPIKLQLQRLIRLKQNGNPKWEELFDEASKVILEHIDILTDTANQFSTFAKLYTEDPVEFDMDSVLRDEISMFDSRGDVHFDYFGLPGAVVSGPKPQLVRVFVNLLGNAVQACGPEGGKVQVSLRNGSTDGFYEIVFEDNGPGVAEENVDKLFTPNFTTKNGGSGLGLAISRGILDRCGATMSYSRSFSLGGACFKILYPKTICHS